MTLLIVLSAQLCCQLLKFLVYSVRDRRISISHFFMTGGFISSHSAFVSALVMYVALSEGFTSTWFSVSAVFAIIVIHDAFHLRGKVQKHARLLNKLLKELPEDRQTAFSPLSEQIGHNKGEVLTGILFGSAYAFLLWNIMGF